MGEVVLKDNMTINYFADKQYTEKILKEIEKMIKKRCFYCMVCDLCKKFTTYRLEFKQKGFWTFNKDVRHWNIYDPDWSTKNTFFKLIPIKAVNFGMQIF